MAKKRRFRNVTVRFKPGYEAVDVAPVPSFQGLSRHPGPSLVQRFTSKP